MYIRLYTSYRGIFSPVVDTTVLKKKLFSVRDQLEPEISVFKADSNQDELRSTAAFAINPGRKCIIDYWFLRISDEDLESVGAKLVHDGDGGNTGVLDVDSAHYLIKPSQIELDSLIVLLHTKVADGADIIRYVGESQIKRHIERFAIAPVQEVKNSAKKICSTLLKEKYGVN